MGPLEPKGPQWSVCFSQMYAELRASLFQGDGIPPLARPHFDQIVTIRRRPPAEKLALLYVQYQFQVASNAH